MLGTFGVSVVRSTQRQLAVDLGTIGDIELIVDVGVAQGTPELYRVLPNAYLILVEPLELFRNSIEHLLASRPGEWFRCAAGDDESNDHFIVCADPRKSGRQPRPSSSVEGARHEEVAVHRLDALLQNHPAVRSASGRILLKVDCEGDEAAVLRGAGGLLPHIRVILVECSMGSSDHQAVARVVSDLDERGFALFDVVQVGRRAGIAQHADLFFVRKSALHAP